MDIEKIVKGFQSLEKGITNIDRMLRKYGFILKIEGVKKARFELEAASRLIKAGLEAGNGAVENTKPDTTDDVSKENDSIDEENDIVDDRDEGIDEQSVEGRV